MIPFTIEEKYGLSSAEFHIIYCSIESCANLFYEMFQKSKKNCGKSGENSFTPVKARFILNRLTTNLPDAHRCYIRNFFVESHRNRPEKIDSTGIN